ncbi:MAG TPA: histidine kinase [Thermoanaerobaculia bacterium]|jgi:hypothetical protein
MTWRHFARLFGMAMAVIGVWMVAGLFTASEFYRRTLALSGATEHVEYILLFQMVQSLNWAWFTPIVVFLAERLPLRKPHLARNALIVIALLPVLALIRAVAGGAILELGEGGWPTRHMMELSISIRLHRNIAIEAMIIVFTNLLLAQREAAQRGQRELDAQTLLARAELDGLRAQLQPHFVFTTLQNIAGTIEKDAAAADRMIVTLAELLRHSLSAGGEAVPLAEELELVDRGATLCSGRSIRFDADDETLGARVPPLFVQQLVDRAGDAGDVDVRAWRDGARLRFEVRGGAAPLEASIPWEGVS